MIKVGDPQFMYLNELEQKRKADEAKTKRDRQINAVVEYIKSHYAGTTITGDILGQVMDDYGLDEVTQKEWTYLLEHIVR